MMGVYLTCTLGLGLVWLGLAMAVGLAKSCREFAGAWTRGDVASVGVIALIPLLVAGLGVRLILSSWGVV
jgi:hypothetical protein